MKYDDNIYEVFHAIDITYENEDKEVTVLTSSFNIIKAASLNDAKKILKDATPKGEGTFVSDKTVRDNKVIYVETINSYTITHKIMIKKNGIALKENPNARKSTEELILEKTPVEKPKKDKPSKPVSKKKSYTKDKKVATKKSDYNKKSSSKSSKKYHKYKRNRTEIKEVNLKDLERELRDT